MHISVLLNECIENLNINESSTIVDCTLGYGGHSSEILNRVKKGFLYSFDQDKDAIAFSRERLNKIGDNYEIINSNFVHIKKELNNRGITKVNGILFDLGVSSPQLDTDERGFSFHKDARLDMRMDQSQSLSAFEVVNNYDKEDLIRILREYGEEKYAVGIVNNIIKYRENKEIETTTELTEIISYSVPFKYKKDHHPSRKTFQAIRIEVNDELNVFKNALLDAIDLLDVGGRICVITFHSLEDKICKSIFKEITDIPRDLRNLPNLPDEYRPKYKVINTIKPSKNEIEDNKRARSSKLRILEKL